MIGRVCKPSASPQKEALMRRPAGTLHGGINLAEFSRLAHAFCEMLIFGPNRANLLYLQEERVASQAFAILRELHALTGGPQICFPGRDVKKPMSDAAINASLRRMQLHIWSGTVWRMTTRK
ncbi:hypothetical protein D9M72_313620 [compost metagenome]